VFELKILFKGVHLTNSEKKCSIERYIVYRKKQKISMSPYSFLFCAQYEKTIFILSLNYQTLKLKKNTQNARSVSFAH